MSQLKKLQTSQRGTRQNTSDSSEPLPQSLFDLPSLPDSRATGTRPKAKPVHPPPVRPKPKASVPTEGAVPEATTGTIYPILDSGIPEWAGITKVLTPLAVTDSTAYHDSFIETPPPPYTAAWGASPQFLLDFARNLVLMERLPGIERPL